MVVDVDEAHGAVEGQLRAVGKVNLVEALVMLELHDALVGIELADLLEDGCGDDLVGHHGAGLLALDFGADAVAVELDVDAALEIDVVLHEAGTFLNGYLFYLHVAVVALDEFLCGGGERTKVYRAVLTVVGRVCAADKKADKTFRL